MRPGIAQNFVVLLLFLASMIARGSTDESPPIFDADQLDQLPVVLSQQPPKYPIGLRSQKIEDQVLVDFLVDSDGNVKSARALPTPHPEFAAAATEAVSQWTFRPGILHGQAVTTRMRVPIVFKLSPKAVAPIHFTVGAAREVDNIRSGVRGIELPVRATGASADQVQAARFLLIDARDDTGAELKAERSPEFSHVSVGRSAGDQAERTSRQAIAISLTGVAKNAKTLASLKGTLEVFLPNQDPDATVWIDHLSSKFGTAIENSALEKAGVTLVVFDQPTADKMYAAKAPGGPQDYDSGPMFGSDYLIPTLSPAIARAVRDAQKKTYDNYPPALAARMRKMNEMGETEIAVGLHDPDHRVVAVEFQAQDGGPLAYNHNGQYHAERTSEGKRFDVYDLPSALPADAKMVCWLLTENSVLKVPLTLAHIPLPEYRNGRSSPSPSPPGMPKSVPPHG